MLIELILHKDVHLQGPAVVLVTALNQELFYLEVVEPIMIKVVALQIPLPMMAWLMLTGLMSRVTQNML